MAQRSAGQGTVAIPHDLVARIGVVLASAIAAQAGHQAHLAFRPADRLQGAMAINAVIAWRLMVMILLGRQVPECAASLMFSDPELEFLRD